MPEHLNPNPTSLLHSHTLPQLPFPLRTLQLQPLHRILQPLLLLHQPLPLIRLGCIRPSRIPTPIPTCTPPLILPRHTRPESPLLQLAFRSQALFPAREFLDMVLGLGQQVVDAGGDFVQEGLLGFMEGWFREEFEVLF